MPLVPALLLAASACSAPLTPLPAGLVGGISGLPVAPAATAATANSPSRPALLLASDSLAHVFSRGDAWESFLEGVQVRRELWHENWESWPVDAQQLARAQATGGPWRILAISDEACSDSVNTLPILARLAALLPDAEFRVVEADAGRPWMEAHRSPDGRASTPTVLLLDENHTLQGCWVEQPAGMAEFWLPTIPAGISRQELPRKMAWYAEDRGQSTLEEFLLVMEAAGRGEMRCPGR
jgi:hypothetical protein